MAFLNGRGAPFADAFLIFPELIMFIQYKKSVVASQQNADDWCSQSQHLIDSDCVIVIVIVQLGRSVMVAKAMTKDKKLCKR